MDQRLRKLNLGCGTCIQKSDECTEWVNLDIAALEGVDIVQDLTKFPWSLPDNTFDEITAYDILEHLPDTIRTMEEIWRILKPGGQIDFRIPYWNCVNSINDPTHIRFFNQNTLEFWNIDSHFYKQRSYYSSAQFRTVSMVVNARLLFLRGNFRKPFLQRFLLRVSNYINNITQNLYIRMQAVK